MTRKCGFFDCNNQVEEGTSCQSCQERKEGKICSACRQPEPQESEVLTFHPSLTKKKYLYKGSTIIRNKLPVQFQTEFDQLLPQLKLTASEQELITEIEKFLSDFLVEKGGKQDHIDWLLFCSVCNPEFNSRGEDAFEKNAQNKTLIGSINKKEKKLENFFADKVSKAISKEELNKIAKEAEEEFYKQIAANPNDNQRPNQQGPGQQGPSQQPNQNDNSEKITHLQQEINSLKQEISDLKNSRNPTPPNSNTLQEKENKLREKENELEKLKKNNNSPSSKQPSKEGNSNLLIYLSLGAVGVVIIVLTVLLVTAKKKKKNEFKLTN